MSSKLDAVILELAYDNGAIFRGREEKEVLEKVHIDLSQHFSIVDLEACETELETLCIKTLCCGTEQQKISELLAELLNEVFISL